MEQSKPIEKFIFSNSDIDYSQPNDAVSSGGMVMNIYSNLVVLGLIGIILLGFASFQVLSPVVSFALTVFSFSIFLLITFINVKAWIEREYDRKISRLKEKYERKIYRLRHEHDTATLERTIRDGTKTLIKNAVDYFKIENIKNEMPPSAAIQNLQLDKYGQIIELLADFSLILPDHEENREIVLQEINHQIEIYEIDEKTFAEFLRTIMGKYLLTVNKKLREKLELNAARSLKSCPKCNRTIASTARICKHCGHQFVIDFHAAVQQAEKRRSENDVADWIKKGYGLYRAGNYEDAVRVFTLAIALDPRARQAYYNRGISYKHVDRVKEAVKDLHIAAKLGHQKARELLNTIKHSDTQEWGPKEDIPENFE
jgi:tetratricopeptide (TPR) repeat protein